MTEKSEGFGRGRKRGLVKSLISLSPEQLDTIRVEAARRAAQRKAGRMDSGEVVREAVDVWSRVEETTKRGYRVIEDAISLAADLAAEGKMPTARRALESARSAVRLVVDLRAPTETEPPEYAKKFLEQIDALERKLEGVAASKPRVRK